MQRFLCGFKEYLQSDAFSDYNWADDIIEMVHVGYHAHARRPFAELAKTHKITGLAHDAIRFYSKLYAVEMEARENQFTPDARHQLGQEKSVPILTALRKWLDHHLPKTSDQGTIGKAIRYCVGH